MYFYVFLYAGTLGIQCIRPTTGAFVQNVIIIVIGTRIHARDRSTVTYVIHYIRKYTTVSVYA